MKVAAIQMVSSTSLPRNLDAAARLLAQAAEQGTELAVLPEYFCIMGREDSDKLAFAETPGRGAIQDFLAGQARQHGLWIVGGLLPMATGDPLHARNCSLAYAPSGECVARYDKMHLFRFDDGRRQYDETRVLEPGREPVAFTLQSKDGHVWRVGMSVCYDLRFPELYRALKADLLLVPSAFTYPTGQAHWELLLRARAVENLACVVAAAQGGEHENGRRTWGHSLVVDPWGSVVAEHAEGEGLALADLAPAQLEDVRKRLPALAHRVL